MSKLTLSVDEEVIARAKKYAKERGVSVSEMVESYLSEVSKPVAAKTRDAPILRSLRGIIKGKVDIEDYKRYLVRKYR